MKKLPLRTKIFRNTKKLKIPMLLTSRSNLRKRAFMRFKILLWMRLIRHLNMNQRSNKKTSISKMNSNQKTRLRQKTKTKMPRRTWNLFLKQNLTMSLQTSILSITAFLSKLRMMINRSALLRQVPQTMKKSLINSNLMMTEILSSMLMLMSQTMASSASSSTRVTLLKLWSLISVRDVQLMNS